MHRLFAVLTLACAIGLPAAAQPAPEPDWTAAQTIEIDLSNFAFNPASLTLKQGVAYRLHFVNRASGGHDYSAKDFFAAATIDPEDQPAVTGGKVTLKGNQSGDVRLIATQTGHFDVICTHLMHATMGMRGEVVVQ